VPAWGWVAIGAYAAITVVVGLIAWGACICGARDDEFMERAVREIRRSRGPASIE